MKRTPLMLFYFLLFISCNRPERGAIDNETLSRKLFDTVRDNDFDKSEILMPDKGTYRKIMKEWKNTDVAESQYDTLFVHAESAFNSTRNMIADWMASKYVNAHTEMMKEGVLQIAKTTTKFQVGTDFYKYTFTCCKYNGRWFYLGDMEWVPKEQM